MIFNYIAGGFSALAAFAWLVAYVFDGPPKPPENQRVRRLR